MDFGVGEGAESVTEGFLSGGLNQRKSFINEILLDQTML